MSPQIFGEKIESLKNAMDYASAKSRHISANIANIETPGYKKFNVILNDKINSSRTSSELATTNPKHISGKGHSSDPNYTVVRDTESTSRVDGNNVDLDKELAEMNANAIFFTALGRFISKNFSGLRSIISEGRR